MRIQLGFNEPGPVLKLFGIRELFCNNCAYEFKRFAPSSKFERRQSVETETTTNRRRATRYKAHLPVRLAKVLKERFGQEPQCGPVLSGHTRDVSKIGLAIILRNVPAEAHDLNDARAVFCAWVDLPAGTVKMRIVPVRREQILSGPGTGGLLIGAHIRGISETDRASLHRYLETLQQ